MQQDAQTREQELREVPIRITRPEDWPKGVRPIAINEMDAIGVDASGMLYWHGKPIAIRRIELRQWELGLAVLATLGTLMSGVAALFPGLPTYISNLPH